MRQARHRLALRSAGRGLYEVTTSVAQWVGASGIRDGLVTLFLRHTSASLLIQENADPDVRQDLEAFLERIAPEDPQLYRHAAEGPDDMPAHLRSALLPTSLSIPVEAGRLQLGTWQGIYLYEHRRAPQQREILLHLVGA